MTTFPTKNDIRAALISASNVEVLIKKILDKLSSNPSGPYPIALLLEQEKNAFSHVIPSDADLEFVDVLKNAVTQADTTCSARAVRQNAYVYVPDMDKDPHKWEDMPGLWWGLLASWTAPLRTNTGRVFGALTLYFGIPKHPSEQEKVAFEEFAGSLGSAVQAYLA